MKVKLWPASSPSSDNLSLTCAAPSLLQKRAVFIGEPLIKTTENKAGQRTN